MVLSYLLLFKGGFLDLNIKLLRGKEICTVKEIPGTGFSMEKGRQEGVTCVKLIAVFNKDIKSYYDKYSGQLRPIATKTEMNYEA